MVQLTHAIKKDGSGEKLVSVDEVSNGIACNCYCPFCDERLIAKNGGTKVAHHFAHESGSDCVHGYQTSLHLMAKEIISEVKRFYVPDIYVHFNNKSKELLEPGKELIVDAVELEKKSGDIIPDIIVYSGSSKLYVEIAVTHEVDEAKQTKIKEQDVSTIEIDLSKFDRSITREELKSYLLGDIDEKRWVYNKAENYALQKFKENAKYKDSIARGMAIHVDYCPLETRVWKGKPYANVVDDCVGCGCCIEYGFERILCSGETGIVTCEDLEKHVALYHEDFHVVENGDDVKVSKKNSSLDLLANEKTKANRKNENRRIRPISSQQKLEEDFITSWPHKQFCPKCGGSFKFEGVGLHAFLTCEDCASSIYPNWSTRKLLYIPKFAKNSFLELDIPESLMEKHSHRSPGME